MADSTLRFPGDAVVGAPPAPGRHRIAPRRDRVADAVRRATRAITPAAVARYAWAAFWLPYWFSSDVPPPHLPARDPRPPANVGLAGEQVVRTLDRLCRRIWLLWVLNVVVRGAWLGGLVGVGWLVVELAGGPELDAGALVRVAIALFALGVVFAALIRPTRRRTAEALDRSFHLHERMTTALENLGRDVPPPGVRAQVVYLQMADAANVIAELRRHPAFRFRLPLRELVLALACALLLASLYFLRGVGGGIPDVTATGVPPFTSAADQPRPEDPASNPAAQPPSTEQAPSTAEVQERAARSNEARRDLATLGQALDDHAVTSQAADAIARGDYDEAAEELRDLAANAGDMTPESREALADDLDAAADQMSEGSSELADATRAAADGLREGGEPAQTGLQELGDAVQETGDDVVSQQELANQMAAAQAAESSGSQGQSGESGESGDEQAGEAGDQGEAGEGQRPMPGQNDGGPGDPMAGDPGEPGSEGEQAESGQPAAQPADRGSNPGQAQNQGQGQGEQRGRTGRSSSAAQPGAPQSGGPQPGEAGAQGPEGGMPGENLAETGGEPQAGGGAGSGDAEDQAGGQQEGAPAGDQPGAGEGPPAEEQVTTAEQPEGGEPSGDPREADAAIRLDNTGGPGMQTGNDPGSASPGSGTGQMAGSGEATQQEVGEAGPDSNRVPPEYRDVVAGYFSDPTEDE